MFFFPIYLHLSLENNMYLGTNILNVPYKFVNKLMLRDTGLNTDP